MLLFLAMCALIRLTTSASYAVGAKFVGFLIAFSDIKPSFLFIVTLAYFLFDTVVTRLLLSFILVPF